MINNEIVSQAVYMMPDWENLCYEKKYSLEEWEINTENWKI